MSSSRLGQSVLQTSVGNLVPPVVGLVTAPLLAQALGVDGRGELAAATAPLLVATVATAFGLPEAVTYYVARRWRSERYLLRRAGWMLIAAGLLATAATAAAAPVLSGGNAHVADLIRLAMLALTPALLVGLLRAVAAGHQAWWLVSVERSLGSVIRLLVLVCLFASHALTPVSATLALAVTHFAGVVAYLLLPGVVRQAKLQAVPGPEQPSQATGLQASSPRPGSFLTYGLAIWPGALTGILLMRTDQILMIPLAGAYELGIYAVAVTIAEVSLVFNSAVKDVVFSAESFRQDNERLAATARISTVMTLLIGVGLSLVALWAVPLFFGQDFTPAVPVVWVLLLGIVLGNPGTVAGSGLSARGRPGLRSLSTAVALAVNVLLLVLLVPVHGPLGAAWASLAGNLVAGLLNIWWLRRHFGLPASTFSGARRSDGALVKEFAGVLKR